MKVLMINGSPNAHGTTRRALDEMAAQLNANGVEAEIFHIGNKPVRGCIGCWKCNGRCIFNDDVNIAIEKMEQSDGLVIASPVYFASPNGSLLAFLDRMFAAGSGAAFEGKPAAVISVARRAGTTATLDALTKYPSINNMPLVTSSYWTMVHGTSAAEAEQDAEGLQVMRNLGRNMAWLLKCIELGKQSGVAFPSPEEGSRTNFIR